MKKFIWLLGLKIEEPSNVVLNIPKTFNLLILIMTMIQIVIQALKNPNDLFALTIGTNILLFTLQTFVKFCVVIHFRGKLDAINAELNLMNRKLNEGHKNFLAKLVIKSGRVLTATAGSFFFMSFIFSVMIISAVWIIYFMSGEWNYLYPLNFWWPFDRDNFYFLVYIFEFYAGLLHTFGHFVVDAYILLIFIQLIAHFKILEERFVEAINNAVISPSAAKDKLKECIDDHCNILKMTHEMITIYGLPFLLNVCCSSTITCMVLYYLQVRLIYL